MGRPSGPEAAPPRPPRELSRALRRLRWTRQPVLWLAAPGALRRHQLSSGLRRLQRRFRVVRLPYGAIPAAEICAAVLAELEWPLAGDPPAALLQALESRSRRRGRLLIAIEEADRMPLAEATRLRELVARSAGALRLLLVTSPGPEGQRLGTVLSGGPRAPRRSLSARRSGGAGPSPPRAPSAPAGELRAPSGQGAQRAPTFRARHVLPPLRPSSHPAAQEALAALEEGLRQGVCVLSLEGPPGMGKTLLLRELAERVCDALEPVWVPCMALAGEELLRWILYCRRGRDLPQESATERLRELAGPGAGQRGLLLLLDDAGALTPGAASELASALAASGGRLRVAMSRCDGAAAPGADALGNVRRVRLEAPLADVHAAALLRDRFGAALDDGVIRRIVDEACGVPAALIRGASVRLGRRYGLS